VNGGYDSGYVACPCFWGRSPGSLVRLLEKYVADFRRLDVLDAGCGEGKNAAFLSQRGARVQAIDISDAAIKNGKMAFGNSVRIEWAQGDIRNAELERTYDIVIAYGLLHCLPSEADVAKVIRKIQNATVQRGYNVLCALNDRRQDLSAHPDLNPTLIPHSRFLEFYGRWDILHESDTDLTETHPHPYNNIKHTHSLTRILARKI
jgi:tellurite methyltransferase